jgi:hypothetical protein
LPSSEYQRAKLQKNKARLICEAGELNVMTKNHTSHALKQAWKEKIFRHAGEFNK